MNHIIEISNFKFKSLRKYLEPVYIQLRLNSNLSANEKKLIAPLIAAQFFKRMREHRKISIERIARLAEVSVDYLELFERGEVSPKKQVEFAYCQACCAFHECHYFMQQILENSNPEIKEKVQEIALDAFKRFGVVIPTVDYKNLHEPRGKILEFPLGQ